MELLSFIVTSIRKMPTLDFLYYNEKMTKVNRIIKLCTIDNKTISSTYNIFLRHDRTFNLMKMTYKSNEVFKPLKKPQ